MKETLEAEKQRLEAAIKKYDAQQKTGAEALKSFNLDKHVRRYLEYNPDLPLHVSFDENVNPHITCGIYQIVTGKDLVREVRQLAEVCPKPPFNSRKNAAALIQKLYPGHKAGLFIYGDARTDAEAIQDISEGLK